MTPRRAHDKSRNGCHRCKLRRVKCDEQRPICGNCNRRSETCSFGHQETPPLASRRLEPRVPAINGAADIHGDNLLPSPAESLVTTPQPRDLPAAELPLLDLELLHHFVVDVYTTLIQEPKSQTLWQVEVPKEALRYPYLMHCILAIAALHLQFKGEFRLSQQEYSDIAISYYDQGIARFCEEMANITPENCCAIWAAATLTTIFSMAFPILPQNLASFDPIEDLLGLCELAKGATVVLQSAREALRYGKLAPFLSPLPWDDLILPQDIRRALEGIQAECELLREQPDEEVYREAMHGLRETFKAVTMNQNHPTLVLYWLVFLPRRFIEMIRSRTLGALVLAALYAVVLNQQKQHWWLGKRGELLLDNIAGIIGNSNHHHIRWATALMGTPAT
jgi:Fungal specific transcription factor domain/Fungal Zn(2)-Cys(6) binuclear cluster domain